MHLEQHFGRTPAGLTAIPPRPLTGCLGHHSRHFSTAGQRGQFFWCPVGCHLAVKQPHDDDDDDDYERSCDGCQRLVSSSLLRPSFVLVTWGSWRRQIRWRGGHRHYARRNARRQRRRLECDSWHVGFGDRRRLASARCLQHQQSGDQSQQSNEQPQHAPF